MDTMIKTSRFAIVSLEERIAPCFLNFLKFSCATPAPVCQPAPAPVCAPTPAPVCDPTPAPVCHPAPVCAPAPVCHPAPICLPTPSFDFKFGFKFC